MKLNPSRKNVFSCAALRNVFIFKGQDTENVFLKGFNKQGEHFLCYGVHIAVLLRWDLLLYEDFAFLYFTFLAWSLALLVLN